MEYECTVTARKAVSRLTAELDCSSMYKNFVGAVDKSMDLGRRVF